MLEHHCAGPYLTNRVCNAFTRDVRRRTVHRLEHRREICVPDSDWLMERCRWFRYRRDRGLRGCLRRDSNLPRHQTSQDAARSALSECRYETGLIFIRGYSALITLNRSSQNGMVIVIPFDLVAEVTCFFVRLEADLEGVAAKSGRRRGA